MNSRQFDYIWFHTTIMNNKKKKKIFILLPDGVGLRNFAFTSFVEIGEEMGWEVVFWNHTPFNLQELGYREIKLLGKPRATTDLLKRAKIEAELDHFTAKFDDPIYQTYKFPPSNKGIKRKVKNALVSTLVKTHSGEEGLEQLREEMRDSERKGKFYRKCEAILEAEKPEFIFCTNQRPVTAIAPITAAQDLGITTATFIFSWDNLPKATMVVDTDHYFVWSEHMKQELLTYYPTIQPKQIHITGSPQFEPHFDTSLRKKRTEFFKENGLDPEKKYLCFSGDDSTTCPDDHHYLNDVAEAVTELNRKGENLGIIFRRSPVDLSARYEQVLEKHSETITPLAPIWKKTGENWNAILPTREDIKLQVNTILHTEAVINLASSMVFDFAIFNKPCLYLNYVVDRKQNEDWSPQKVYDFVHFRSMPQKEPVLWIRSKEELEEKIMIGLGGAAGAVAGAKDWFQKINKHPPQKASERIWEVINGLPRPTDSQ